MAIDFVMKDVIHRVITKFVPAYLPGAKKKYNARAVFQPELDIHGIASKASVYNITTSPKIIEEGFLAAEQLMIYLAADNYRITTSLFHMGIRIPGEYDGTETHLPAGVHPEVRLTVSNELRNYIRDHVHIEFDGIEDGKGVIGEVVDDATGNVNTVVTMGNIVTVHGYGLKIESDEAHAAQAGAFLVNSDGGDEIRVKAVALNEPRTLKLLIPTTLSTDTDYTLLIRTQASAKTSRHLLKDVREVRSDFTLKARE
jgi:hypothetical protein